MPRSASPSATAPVHSSIELRDSVAHAQPAYGPKGMDSADAFLGGAALFGQLEPTSHTKKVNYAA